MTAGESQPDANAAGPEATSVGHTGADTSAYYTAPAGSAQHYAAYEAMYTADHGIGYPAADPQTSYEIDNAAELAAERYYEELAAQHEADTAGPFETPEPVIPPQPSTELEAEPW